MKEGIQIVPIEMDDDTVIKIEAVMLGGEQDVAFGLLQFEDITKLMGKVAKGFVEQLRKVSPNKIQIELGISVGIESGQLTALLTQGSGNANFKIALEWENSTND